MKLFTFFSVISAFFLSGCTMTQRTDQIPAVKNFDVQRYLGTWYEIARYPHYFERGLKNVSANYSSLPDGKIKVINRGINGKGKERIVEGVAFSMEPAGTGELKVSFFRPFYGAYRIIYLSPEYDLAIVTSSTKEFLWILSRRKELSQNEKELCLEKLKSWEFSPTELIWVKQN